MTLQVVNRMIQTACGDSDLAKGSLTAQNSTCDPGTNPPFVIAIEELLCSDAIGPFRSALNPTLNPHVQQRHSAKQFLTTAGPLRASVSLVPCFTDLGGDRSTHPANDCQNANSYVQCGSDTTAMFARLQEDNGESYTGCGCASGQH